MAFTVGSNGLSNLFVNIMLAAIYSANTNLSLATLTLFTIIFSQNFSKTIFYLISVLRNLIPTIAIQISQSVLPINPAMPHTGNPGRTVANNSACAIR